MKDKDIIKGFNQGYILQKHQPELAEKLIKGMQGQKSDYLTAFFKGAEEWQKEKAKQRPKEIKMNYRLKDKGLPKIEKDKAKDRSKEK